MPCARAAQRVRSSRGINSLFIGFDCVGRAYFSAIAAVGAGVGIDHVLIFTFADGIDGAFVGALSTGDAITGNSMRHQPSP